MCTAGSIKRCGDEEPVSQQKPWYASFAHVVFYEPRLGEDVPWYFFFKQRYFRAVSYLLTCLLVSIVYVGWQPLYWLLHRDGAYEWYCLDSSNRPIDKDEACLKQHEALTKLSYLALASESLVGAVAGVCYDRIGPFYTAFIGEIMLISGWLCLIYSSQALQLYIPAFILMGGAANMLAFPALVLSNYFPSYENLVIGIIVAAQTASSSVPNIFRFIKEANNSLTLKDICWMYLYVIVFPVGVLFLITLPLKRPTIPDHEKSVDSDIILEENVSAQFPKTVLDSDTSVSNDQLAVSTVPIEIGISFQRIDKPSFLSQIVSFEYLLFYGFYVLQLLQYAEYPNALRSKFTHVGDFLGYVLPSQAIFGIIFGLVERRTKTIPICFALCCMMTLAYCLALSPNADLQYFTAVLYVISNSYIYATKYTFVADMFPPYHFGALIGIMGGASGIFLVGACFVSIDYYVACIVYIVFGIIASVFVLVLYWRWKKGISYKFSVRKVLSKVELNSNAETAL